MNKWFKLCIMLVAIFVLTGCSRGIDGLSLVSDIHFDGKNTIGYTYEPQIDTERIYRKIKDRKLADQIVRSLKVSIDKKENLSNGDIVNVTVTLPDDLAKYVKTGTKEYKVSGLVELQPIAMEQLQQVLEFNFSGVSGRGNVEIVNKATDYLRYVQFEVENNGKLTNGEQVKFNVTPSSRRALADEGYSIDPNVNMELTVTDLKEPVEITVEELHKHLVIEFAGVSGKGVATITNAFQDPVLSRLNFNVEKNEQLSNGDQVKLLLDPYQQEELADVGYALPSVDLLVEVSGLSEVPKSATEISNVEDIKRLIKEEVAKRYSREFEITLVNYYYRQFGGPEGVNDGIRGGRTNSGTLLGIFQLKPTTSWGSSGVVVTGFTDIMKTPDGKADLATMSLIYDHVDENYSADSIVKLYEAYGYTLVQ